MTQAVAAVQEGEETAQAVNRAFQAGMVHEVKLGGIHSRGSQLAQDPKTGDHWLLKPNSGGVSPAAGVAEERASPANREAAFYHVARYWGLADDIPQADLLYLDGQPVAAIKFLSHDYRTLEDMMKQDRAKAIQLLERYRMAGRLHQWSVIDLVLGQTDRHAGNEMIGPDGDIKLIDDGSAFAGKDFDPADDRDTYTPIYLRYHVPQEVRFNQLSPVERLRLLQQAPNSVRKALRSWLMGLSESNLETVLRQYGIDPEPSLQRLRALKVDQEPVDIAANRLWTSL